MAQQIRLWEVKTENAPVEIPREDIDLEKHLQDWLAANISMLDPELLVIGREVTTDFGGRIDLLCLDRSGGLVVVEIKKEKTPREVTAQVLDYACWIRDLDRDDITRLSAAHDIAEPLDDAFKRQFGDELPGTLNESHRLLIVAEKIDDSTERIVRYLFDLGVPINVATVQHFRSKDGREMLAQVLMIEPESVADAAKIAARRSKSLTVRESYTFAEERGVGNLYRELRNAAYGKFVTMGVGKASIGLAARVNDGTRTILVIDLSNSNPESGLSFRLNATRLIKYFGLDEQQIQNGLPATIERMQASNWHGSATDNVEEWKGFKGCFFKTEEIHKFMDLLKSQPRDVEG